MTTFPLDCPISLTTRPGQYPVQTYRTVNGATRTRLFGSLPVNATISAQFRCTTAEAASVWEAYYATRSGALPIIFPTALFTGHEALAAALPQHLTWFMTEEPDARFVLADVCDLSVEFEGRLEV